MSLQNNANVSRKVMLWSVCLNCHTLIFYHIKCILISFQIFNDKQCPDISENMKGYIKDLNRNHHNFGHQSSTLS